MKSNSNFAPVSGQQQHRPEQQLAEGNSNLALGKVTLSQQETEAAQRRFESAKHWLASAKKEMQAAATALAIAKAREKRRNEAWGKQQAKEFDWEISKDKMTRPDGSWVVKTAQGADEES